MGFEPMRKAYTLDFTGTELAGLEINTEPISTDQFYSISSIADEVSTNAEYIARLAPEFIAQVRSWNLERKGSAVPVTLEGLFSALEFGQTSIVLEAWIDVMAGVPAPLDQPSSDGALSLVESIPMETLSLDPSNSAVPS